MELQSARQVIESLAQGVHPVTGEVMAAESPYNAPTVIRALHAALHVLDQQNVGGAPAKQRRDPARNAGKAWAAEDDARLEQAFVAGGDLKQLAAELGRTPFAVESRLVRLGQLPPRPGMRLASTAS